MRGPATKSLAERPPWFRGCQSLPHRSRASAEGARKWTSRLMPTTVTGVCGRYSLKTRTTRSRTRTYGPSCVVAGKRSGVASSRSHSVENFANWGCATSRSACSAAASGRSSCKTNQAGVKNRRVESPQENDSCAADFWLNPHRGAPRTVSPVRGSQSRNPVPSATRRPFQRFRLPLYGDHLDACTLSAFGGEGASRLAVQWNRQPLSLAYEPVPLSISDRACSTSSAVAPISLAERAWVSSSLRWRRSRW